MDSQTEVRNLFNKLHSWRETSQREFSHIIEAYSVRVNKGVDVLVEEVCYLKAELSVIKEERNDLLGRVGSLSGEVNQLRDKLDRVQPEESVETIDQGFQEVATPQDIKGE